MRADIYSAPKFYKMEVNPMDNTMNTNTVNNEKTSQSPKKRGRPAKKSTEKRTKKFNLLMRDETFTEINRFAAKEQLSTGRRTSANEIINNIVEGYIKKIKDEEKLNNVQTL